MPFFQNRFVKIAAFVILGLFVILFLLSLLTTTRYQSSSFGLSSDTISAPNMGIGGGVANYAPSAPAMRMEESADSSYYYPQPSPDGYTSGLEEYETTQYSVSAKTKEFDALCGSLTTLKVDTQIHFKSLNTSTNNCRATFYVEEAKVQSVLDTLGAYDGVEFTRYTQSVTRHRQQIESQTSIVEQQLARTESSLRAAEAQFARLNELFYSSNEVTKLSGEVTNSMRYIDQLTAQKINYLRQLDNLYQQAADLEERIDVVQFDANFSRALPIYPNQDSQKWGQAWKSLSDTYTDTLIGLSAFFGVFLLWTLRIALYLLVLLIIVRLFWKFVELLWRRV